MIQTKFFYLSFIGILLFQIGNAQVLQEQVIPGELPDPSIVEVDGKYYATGSSNDWGPIYPIYESTDLKNWKFLTYVFQDKPDWTISSFWAPELFYRNGTFYCYYTAKRKDGISMIGVASTKDITKGFQDRGELLEWGSEAIDAFVYDDKGELYITWKAYGLDPDKPIQILGSQLSDDGLSLKGKSFQMLTAESNTWEKGGIEGQCIIRNGDYLYIIYSGNACCGERCDYQVGIARSKSLKGPWQKFEQNPILVSNDSWKCPGHGTALKTNGNWYYLYHAYNSEGFPYLGRVALLSKLKWKDETDWPYFTEINSGNVNYKPDDFTDKFEEEKLQAPWVYNIPAYGFQAKLEDGKLYLSDNTQENLQNSGSFLGISPQADNFNITTEIVQENSALKSLTLYTTTQNSLGIGVQNKSLTLWKMQDGNFEILNEVLLEKSGNIYLKAEVEDAHLIHFKYSLDGKIWKAVSTNNSDDTVVGDNLDWWSWGMKAGVSVKKDSASDVGEFESFHIIYQ